MTPYLFAGLFHVDSINCPITTYTLWTRSLVGVYSAYLGTDITVPVGTGYLTIQTATTHINTIYVKAMTASGSHTYSQFYFEVCDHIVLLAPGITSKSYTYKYMAPIGSTYNVIVDQYMPYFV